MMKNIKRFEEFLLEYTDVYKSIATKDKEYREAEKKTLAELEEEDEKNYPFYKNSKDKYNNSPNQLIKLIDKSKIKSKPELDKKLIRSAELGNLNVVKFFIENGANVNYNRTQCLRNASSEGHLKIVEYLIKNGADVHADEEGALKLAVFNGYLEIVKFLIENGADYHIDNNYILRLANEKNHLDIVKYLKNKK